MQVELLHYTKDYHKLVEHLARQCYQSYDKVNENSHKFVKNIMKKGHLSIASVGNMIFKVSYLDWNTVPYDILTMKEINNFVRSTNSSHKESQQDHIIISMNMLSFLDIMNASDKYEWHTMLFVNMMNEVLSVKELAWFCIDVELEPKENEYINMGNPSFYNPILLTEDYTKLKKLGLSDYELNIHSTMTLNYMTDRSVGLQLWRHGDMTGGTELSQRYVDRRFANFRIPEGDKDIRNYVKEAVVDYESICSFHTYYGVKNGLRAKEIARSVLPNAMATQIIQCRPLRQWLHLFELRDSVHAQKECREDVQSFKKVFEKTGIPTTK